MKGQSVSAQSLHLYILRTYQTCICKMDRNKAEMRKFKNTTPVWNDGSLLSCLQCNALASLVPFVVHFVVCKVNFVVCKVNQGCKCTLHWRPRRRPPSFRSRTVLLSFLITALFLFFLQVQPKLEMKFLSHTCTHTHMHTHTHIHTHSSYQQTSKQDLQCMLK